MKVRNSLWWGGRGRSEEIFCEAMFERWKKSMIEVVVSR